MQLSDEDVSMLIQNCRSEYPEAVRNPSSPGGVSVHFAVEYRVICAYGAILDLQPATIALLSAAEPFVLVTRSSGGAVEPWLLMAERLRQRPAAVVVDGLCASSCANYGFLVAEEKIVTYGSYVVWHGGPTNHPDAMERAGIRLPESESGRQFRDLAERTESLFDGISVSIDLLNDTMLSAPSESDIDAFQNDEAQMVGFAVPPELLEHCYGVHGLDRMWHPGGSLITQFASASLFGGGWIAVIPERAEARECIGPIGLRTE